MLEQAVLGVWCTLAFVKDSPCVLSLTTEASYTAIFPVFLVITEHLELACGDFQDLICAACRIVALPSSPVAFPFLQLPLILSFPGPECHGSDALAALSKYSLASAAAPCTVWCFSSALTVLWSALTSALHCSQFGNEQTLEKYALKVHAVRKLKKGFTS